MKNKGKERMKDEKKTGLILVIKKERKERTTKLRMKERNTEDRMALINTGEKNKGLKQGRWERSESAWEGVSE